MNSKHVKFSLKLQTPAILFSETIKAKNNALWPKAVNQSQMYLRQVSLYVKTLK